MNRRNFVPTLRAFSFAAIAALAFAGGISSCSNMGGDVEAPIVFFAQAPAANPASAVVELAAAPVKMGSVSGTIAQNGSEPLVARSVVPTLDEVKGSIASYTVSAWGTKADGTVVPETSPITVDTTTTTFNIGLEYGTWHLRADAKNSSDGIMMTQTAADPITLDDTNPVVNLNFALDYAQVDGQTGAMALDINCSASGICQIDYRLKDSADNDVAFGTEVNLSGITGTFTLDSSQESAFGMLAPGNYQLIVEFKAADGSILMRMDQSVQIYSNITTNKIDGTAPYINAGSVDISADVIKKYQQSVIYVGGTGIGPAGKAADDSNNGTQFDPVEHIERALQIINSSLLTSADIPDGFKIYLKSDVTLSQNIDIASSQKISIIGTNQSAPWTIRGATAISPLYSITSSGDFSCSYVIFEKLNGFEISGGLLTMSNCKITNGVSPSAKGGGGLCVDVGGAKASLTNCVISGCSADTFGGAIYVAADSGSGTAELELSNCLIGQESSACATSLYCSNRAPSGGGGINVGLGGKAVIKDTKILYNSTNSTPGGGIRCVAGTIEISGGQINYNYAEHGGGIFIMGPASDVTINGCAVGMISADTNSTDHTDCANYSAGAGGGIQIESGKLVSTTGFSVIKNYASGLGGGINVAGAATLELTKVVVDYNCTPSTGGGINLSLDTTSFKMLEGHINANVARTNGGGLSTNTTSGAAQQFEKVQVSRNQCSGNGGGIQVTTGHFLTAKDCSITSNEALGGKGGGIYAPGTLTIEGDDTLISGNTAEGVGGGIYGGKKLVISGGVIKGNSSKSDNGGGVAMENPSDSPTSAVPFTMSGSAQILANTTPESGAGVYLKNAALTMSDSAAIIENIATNWGGGIYMEQPYSALTIKDSANIEGNEGTDGGGINAIGGTVEMSGGTIKGNKGTDGGGIRLYGSAQFTMTGGEISGNSATGNGGGVAVMKDATFVIGGSAYIPAGTDKKNDVYLFADDTGVNRTISLVSSLTATETPVATITPGSYGNGKKVVGLAASSTVTSATMSAELAKLKVKDTSWTIGKNSSDEGVLTVSEFYVRGDTGVDDDSHGTDPMTPYKTLAYACSQLIAPNCIIHLMADTTETLDITIPEVAKGLAITAWGGVTQKKVTASVNKQLVGNGNFSATKITFDHYSVKIFAAGSDTERTELNDVEIKNAVQTNAGGGLNVSGVSVVSATNLKITSCQAQYGGGGINVTAGGKFTADGITISGCKTGTETVANGGGIRNYGSVSLKDAKILGCTAGGVGAGIYNYAELILDNETNIDSEIYLAGKNGPINLKAYFELAIGAGKIPVAVEMDTSATNPYVEGDVVVKGSVTEAKCKMFEMPGSKYSIEYDGTPPCGKLVDKSIAGGVTVNLGGNISFEIGTPSASGEKARFNVIDNSSGTPTYVTPTSAQIKILQYGTPVYSADAQEVAATYLAEGQYELYCKAVVGGVTYDTTLPFGAGAKYTPLTLEAATANAKVTFTNRAADVVTYKKNGGAAQTIASGDSAEITLDNIGDKVQFFGDNTKYGASGGSANCSNISCTDECYVYGNVMSLVNSSGFASEDTLTGTYNFAYLFYNNTKIRNKTGYALVLPATTLTEDCYYAMFYGCSLITVAPELPATTLEKECYYAMFCNCASLKTVPALSATTLANESCRSMFCNCTSLETAPELPATNLASWCYHGMFSGCSSLTAAPALPATTLASWCYEDMFKGCTSLTTAPALPATTLASYCYKNMFSGCTNLATALALPATTLANECYYAMFYGCTSLATAPALPATTLAEGCYNGMFLGCTSLATAPELPAMTLATECYQQMFNGCTSLATAPALPATTLASWCYYGMFRNCKELTTAPELPATILKNNCYKQMFKGCTKLNSVTCLATDISAEDCTTDWLDGVATSGTFTKAAGMTGWTIDSASGIPTGWTVESVGSAIPAGFVKVEGATITGGDKFKVDSNTGVFVSGRTVTLSDFYMCDHEVTQAEYQVVMGSNPSNFTGSDDLPVEQVSWFDAIYYCNKKSVAESLTPCYSVGGKTDPGQWGYTPHNDASISGAITCNLNADGYRLPTEAEWEYAALGGKAGVALDDPTDYAGTNNSSQLGTYAWYSSNSDSNTHAVKTKTKNSLNLFDMSGNVWEWCWDWKNSSATAGDGGSASVTNPLGASSGSGRVYRGGSWRSDASSCSVAIRNGSGPFDRGNNLGFRVVRTAP